MENLGETEEFVATVKSVFSSSAHVVGGRTRKDQRKWWSDFYLRRPKESSTFERFLMDPESPLCRVTGHVGSGKTAFVLEKLQRAEGQRICNGFWINIAAIASDLREVEVAAIQEFVRTLSQSNLTADDVQEQQREIVISAVSEYMNWKTASDVRDRFVEHFTRFRAGVLEQPEHYARVDLRHRLDIDYRQMSELEKADASGQAWIDLAGTLVLHRYGRTLRAATP